MLKKFFANGVRTRFIGTIACGWFLLLAADRVDPLRVYQGGIVAIYVIAIASVILLTGYSGQVSLGQGAFMAIGGFSAALSSKYWHLPFFLTLIVAVLAGALAGALLGGGAARLSGPYLAGITLALAIGLPNLANQFSFLGGEQGLDYSVGDPPLRFGMDFTTDKWFFWITGLAALITLWWTQNILMSRYGRTWRALRSNPAAAQLAGIHVGRVKVLAFTLSAGLAGLAGALLSMTLFYALPSAFPLSLSFALVTGAVLAGVTHLLGSMLGAIVLVAIPAYAELLANKLGGAERVIANLPGLMISTLLILAVLFTPNGPGEQWRTFKEKKGKKDRQTR
ncbi:MAG: branched-chain amino acid ABC transporter permease [Actinobacteria bacterium]|uniref:Unannotated protein n=1 Tax=freshwater metagenome TaxID=449393 RepID=A0A6J6L1G3_9ZZZZ|nr:branched-chain amino acid ABC transporter permease [Actinomycetota bacterium]MSW47481.1 branched-chain amino acid ABC transporter permease [Actinomycetota bacterium]MSX24848.1 branched-chain amino acid ABC transporter permease [Actinomycetota bacterium]MSY45819.1 branched-chain amino acid ABC transporter permease [Actinomycetota bacterium]MSY57173.1 branched-chain amino acid ABC transporter permease [Actinomycetota bacterium]